MITNDILKDVTVLYVEDDIAISEEVEYILLKKVKNVYIAYNGLEGLELFKKYRPDVIITDIEMPKLNGLEMVAQIKEEDKTTPIIVTSAFSETDKLLKAIELKVDTYLLKPINLKELFEKIEKLTKNKFLEKELEIKKALEVKEKELRAYKERMDYAFAGSNDGLWDLDMVSGEYYISARYKEILGYKDDELPCEPESWYKTLYIEDKEYVESSMEATFNAQKDKFEIEFRQKHKNGKLVWILSRAKVTYDKNGVPLRVIGTHTDITEKKEIEQKLLESEKMLSEAQKIAHIGSLIWKVQTKELFWSDEVFRIFGEEPQSFEPSYDIFMSYLSEEDKSYMQTSLKNSLQNRQSSYKVSHKIRRRNGNIGYIQCIAEISYNNNGEPLEMMGAIHDITEQKLSEAKIQEYLEVIDENIITTSTDLDGVIQDASSAFSRLTGYTKEELIGKTHAIIRDPSIRESFYKKMWDTLQNDKVYKGEIKNIKKDGSTFWVSITIWPVYNSEGIKRGYFAIKENITDKKIIERLSITDELTQLYNRRYFNRAFRKEINRSRRDNSTVVFVMLDVDNFKLYNDNYGHQRGDEVLKNVANLLQEFTSRAGDYAFRLGGEEFGLILQSENTQNTKDYIVQLLKGIEALKIEHKSNTVSNYITVSMGVAFSTKESSIQPERLYFLADKALYKAKEEGRNRVVFS